MVSGSTASVAPGNLNLTPETLEWDLAICVLGSLPGDSGVYQSLRATSLGLDLRSQVACLGGHLSW